MDKKALRREIGALKKQLTAEQIETASAALARQLFAHPIYQAAQSIYGYLSYNQEVRTMAILNRPRRTENGWRYPRSTATRWNFCG